MHILKTFVVLIIIVLSVTFIVQNAWILNPNPDYKIRYLNYTTPSMPPVVLFLFCILLGSLFIAGPSFIKNQQLKRLLRVEKKKIAQMEKELSSLRNLPITDERNIERINKES